MITIAFMLLILGGDAARGYAGCESLHTGLVVALNVSCITYTFICVGRSSF